MPGHEATHDAPFSQTENPFFFTDPYGAQPHHEPVADNASDLDSSEDEVVFSGRQQNPRPARPHAATATATATATADTVTPVVVTILDDDIGFLPQQTAADKAVESEWLNATRDSDNPQDSYISLSSAKKRTRNRKKKNKTNKVKMPAQNDENAIISDYVRNVIQQDSPSDDEQLPRFGLGLSNQAKNKFRELSTLDVVEESEVLASEDDGSDSDDSSLLEDIRRGASFTMMDESWESSNDLSADMLEDVDFDIIDMQQDGPLRKKNKKGRKPIDFGLSDSELELRLEEAWERDRSKKRAKKREREQLRAEGLLGKKQKKPDRRSKDLAFGMDELKVELKKFLQSQSDSLDLPPMKKHHRRVVHELANALTLKSQSRGSGSARFPVLYKTARTPNFNGKHSVQLDKILAQPRFNRINPKSTFRVQEPKNYNNNNNNNNNRRRPNMAASYLEGEVVGGSAPEIGADNKGRAMLEKMGWSTGTALGALHNKGILQPVAHVVKNTRAGLG